MNREATSGLSNASIRVVCHWLCQCKLLQRQALRRTGAALAKPVAPKDFALTVHQIPAFEVVKKWDWLRTELGESHESATSAVPVPLFHNVFS